MRANPLTRTLYRIAVAIVGLLIVLVGILLLPLPGPGWLVIFLGLGVLATEFTWARRLLRYARGQVRRWTAWVARRSLGTRLLIGFGVLLITAGLVAGYVAWRGIPFVDW